VGELADGDVASDTSSEGYFATTLDRLHRVARDIQKRLYQ
jgi:hypothetical protein